MSEWKQVKLGEIAEIIDPHPSHRAPSIEDGGIPFIGIGDIDEKGNLIKNARKVSSKNFDEHVLRYQLNENSIGFGRVATIGKIVRFKQYNFKLTISPTMAVIQPKKIDANFLAFSLDSIYIKKQIEKLLTGSTRSSLGIELLRDLNIPVPQFPIQQKIAHIFTTCDTVIEQTQSAIAKYKAIKQGLLHDLFTRGLDTNGKLRPTYQQAPELYKESDLGMIPKEWEVKRLGDVIDAIDPQPDHRTPESVENGIPYLGINDIDSFGNIDLRKCRKVSTVILEEHKRRYQIRNGDIIFGKIGTIGEPKRLLNFNNLTLSANVILIQPRGIADYIYWFLLSEIVNKQINNSIHTTSQPAFGMDKIRSLIIPMCDEIEQNEIAKRLNAINNKIQSEEILLQKYQAIKRGLMGDLLGGRKEVKN